MKIITMATLKGGAGKTMNVFNIAGILAETKKVLLIDVDPQCNLSSDCGIDVSVVNALTVNEIFEHYKYNEQPRAEEMIIKSPIPELPNMDIIPSSISLFYVEEKITLLEGKSFILKNFMSRNADVIKQYDYVLIDTNPSMSIFNINAFYVADSIILSTDVSTNGMRGAEIFCALWDNKREEINGNAETIKEDNIEAMIISNYDRRVNIAKELKEYAVSAEFSKDIVLNTAIPATVRMKDTESYHVPVNILHKNSEAENAYREVVKELKSRGVL